MSKKAEKDETIRAKIAKIKMCPFCDTYIDASNARRKWKCMRYVSLRDNILSTSYRKCTYEDMIQCALLGNYQKEG